MPLFGPPDIAKLKAKGDIPGLVKALGYKKDSAVREAAADALGQMGAPAVDPLIAALRDPVAGWPAADALVQIGDPAIEPLVVSLNDQSASDRATSVLGRIGAPAVKPLLAALADPDVPVRSGAAHALTRIGTPAIEPLGIALKDQDLRVRRAAIQALCPLRGSAVDHLLAALGDPDPEVHGPASETLCKMRGPLDSFVAALRNQPGRARVAAILAELGEPAVEPLIAALGDPDPDVRLSIVRALGDIRDRRAVGPLIAALHDPSEKVRESAVLRLCDFRDERAVAPLVAILEDRDERVREAVARTLDKLAWRPDSGNDGAAYWAAKSRWDMCAKIGVPAVKPLIIALETGVEKANAARTLGEIGDARAVEPLVAALKDPDVRLVAADALDKLAWEPDAGEAGAVYWLLRGRWDKCAEIGAPAVDPLLGVLGYPQSSVRKGAAGALMAIYQSGAMNEALSAKLLAQRGTLTKTHFDVRSECGYHTDTGIGVEFPDPPGVAGSDRPAASVAPEPPSPAAPGEVAGGFGHGGGERATAACRTCGSPIDHFGFTQGDAARELSWRGQPDAPERHRALMRSIGGACPGCGAVCCSKCYYDQKFTCPTCQSKIPELGGR